MYEHTIISTCIHKSKISCESETHSLEKLVEVEVEVLCLAPVEVETAPVAAMHVVLLSLFRVGEHFVSCNGEGATLMDNSRVPFNVRRKGGG